MPRKVSMPGSSDLLRGAEPGNEITAQGESGPAMHESSAEERRSTGRIRHDEKITVYVSREELVRLEQARLTMRAEFAVAVDRGRIVREAVAMALDGLTVEGGDSELLRRLSES